MHWRELPQTGVVRRLKNRDGWSKCWLQRMLKPVIPKPDFITTSKIADYGSVMTPEELGLPGNSKKEMQLGGESKGYDTLLSFLETRGSNYSLEMSSPVSAQKSCSRLSPYLSWGNISMKSVYEAARRRVDELKENRRKGKKLGRMR